MPEYFLDFKQKGYAIMHALFYLTFLVFVSKLEIIVRQNVFGFENLIKGGTTLWLQKGQ